MGKVLFISNCDPFGIGGGSFATRAYVKAFSEALGGDSYILLPEEGASKTDDSIMVKIYSCKETQHCSEIVSSDYG